MGCAWFASSNDEELYEVCGSSLALVQAGKKLILTERTFIITVHELIPMLMNITNIQIPDKKKSL